jgi:pimeloyl-ACP methyl ester carboxylesterase
MTTEPIRDVLRDDPERLRSEPGRVSITTRTNRRLSALRWGSGEPELVLLHGGAQNAHTWDAVVRALDRPVLCLDLPGHGHSDWRSDHDYRPRSIAPDVAEAISALAPTAGLVGGMSLGGMTAIAVADSRPELVRRLAVVDITPGSGRNRTGPLFAFINGPETFASLDEIIDRAARLNPARGRDSLRQGVLNNAARQPDGSWRWRYDPAIATERGVARIGDAMLDMWDAIDRIEAPTLLVPGAKSPAVSDDDIREWRRRQPRVDVVVVDGAGHAVQSDKPLVLARLLSEFFETATAAP